MTDTEKTTDNVTEQVSEEVKKKATKKASKKVAEPKAEKVTEQIVEQASEPASKEDKRAKLANKLRALGMMPGSTNTAAAGETARASLALPAWLSPQLLVLVAGAGVFTLLIWSLEQEKQVMPQQAAYPAPPVYSPYTPYATAPPVMPYPNQPVQQQVQKKTEQAPQSTAPAMVQGAPARPAYPEQAYYRGPYPYGYHPAMQFGFNGYMQGNGAPYYYAYPQRPPTYGYAPNGRARGYGYPPTPQVGQR